MKKLLLFILVYFVSVKALTQTVAFTGSGVGVAEVAIPNKTSAELFNSINGLLSNKNGLNIGQHTITVADSSFIATGTIYNVLGRNSYPNRKPDVAAVYNIEIKVATGKLLFSLQHKYFRNNGQQYFIDFSKFITGQETILIYPGEKDIYNRQFSLLIQAIVGYANTKTLQYHGATHYRDAYKNPLLFSFNASGTGTVVIEKPGLNATELYNLFQSYFSYTSKPQCNDVEKTVSYTGSHYDIFGRKAFIEPEKEIINGEFSISFAIEDGKITATYTHLRFTDGTFCEPIALSYSDIATGKCSDEDRANYIANTSRIINSINYYLNTGEIRR
ncbi:hypothetical protein AM493_18205 [Flavobacterium akiainvivens]|uniref:DUF4468 domain-containing protein n=1 Tax=Flavobacterium akiainvivens TaxID=1202724 RepID=A0A0M8ML45_9FLAO|nr:hypothetical protein [Flavobacterium akiainvivens]KOS07768.1 hypothetical protein AM493_18205 [Flavobacterium akiainvivens]SFQ25922.1 hypothetical protein SAMN05444144_102222 [Flavobacterium akiainvivens]